MLINSPKFSSVTREIIGAAIEVHRALGPGLLESAYQPCLQFELSARKMRFEVQRSIPITYKGLLLSASYRVDLVVEDLVVVEVKSVAELAHGLAALPGQMTVDSALRPISADPPDRTEN